MRSLGICVLLCGLLACSRGGAFCPEGLVACGEECLLPLTPCGVASDGGAEDARSGDAALVALSVSVGELSPAFSPTLLMYTVKVPDGVGSIQVTATVNEPGTSLQINGMQATSGSPSAPIPLGGMVTLIPVKVQRAGGPAKSYSLTVMRSPITPAYVKASNTGTKDEYGFRVLFSGDTLIVGAGGEASRATGMNGDQSDNNAAGSGAVYVYRWNGNTWIQETYLKASNTGAADSFGDSLSLSGNLLVVGAPGEASNAKGVNGNQADDSAKSSGAVYVFRREGTQWIQEAYLKASNPEASDLFGYSVSLSGDTLAVGAPLEDSKATGSGGDQNDNGALSSGAVYVFKRSGTSWTQQAYLKASNTGADDRFGRAVSLSEDTLAVGAYGEDSKATGMNGDQSDNSTGDSGAVYMFQRSGTSWTQHAYLKASNTGPGDLFGVSLFLVGDALVVGAMGEASKATGIDGNQADDSAKNSGAVYVFQRSGASWIQQAYLKASNTGTDDYFGYNLCLQGDTLAVSAVGESSSARGLNGDQADDSAKGSGAVYLFQRSGSTWTQRAYLKASNTEAGDRFGTDVALSGGSLAVGAEWEDSSATGINANQADNNAPESGAVYTFSVP